MIPEVITMTHDAADTLCSILRQHRGRDWASFRFRALRGGSCVLHAEDLNGEPVHVLITEAGEVVR